MAYTMDLGSIAPGRAGSSPVIRTSPSVHNVFELWALDFFRQSVSPKIYGAGFACSFVLYGLGDIKAAAVHIITAKLFNEGADPFGLLGYDKQSLLNYSRFCDIIIMDYYRRCN